jgi:hypothetical protein
MCVKPTSDGGFIVAGESDSLDADGDAYLLKTDANGNAQWSRFIGGSQYEVAQPINQLADGGYIFAGYTFSPPAIGGADAWLVRTDSLGYVLWDTTYHNVDNDFCWRMGQTADGGYILSCYSGSWPSTEIWIIKTDSLGAVLWDTTYGGSGTDLCGNVHPLPDGGYFITASTTSYGAGGYDYWLLRIDSVGNVLWDSTYGGSGDDDLWDSQLTPDGGVAMVGPTNSYGAGSYDIYLYRVDSLGHTIWAETYGGSGNDSPYMLNTTLDSGFIAAGFTTSFGTNAEDLWLVKVLGDGSLHWTWQYGGLNVTREQAAWWVEQLPDESYVISGHDQIGLMNYQLLLVKTGPDPGIEEFTSSNPITHTLTVSPNPFTHTTDIRCQITDNSPEFRIEIYDITGRMIANLTEQISVIGHQLSVNWNGRDQANQVLPSGVYIIKLTVGDNTATKKLLLIH